MNLVRMAAVRGRPNYAWFCETTIKFTANQPVNIRRLQLACAFISKWTPQRKPSSLVGSVNGTLI